MRTGARMIPVVNSAPNQVLSFVRQNEKDKVFVAINFSDKPVTVTFKDALYAGSYLAFFGGGKKVLEGGSAVELKPWGYEVFVK